MICKLEIYNGELNLFPVVTNERVFAQITMGNIVKGQPGKSPIIGENDNWWVYNNETGEYEDTGKIATTSDDVVKYVEAEDEQHPNRKAIQLANGDLITGVAKKEGLGSVNIAMVNEWDVVDLGTSELPINLNTPKGVRPTVQEAGQTGEEANKIAYLSDLENAVVYEHSTLSTQRITVDLYNEIKNNLVNGFPMYVKNYGFMDVQMNYNDSKMYIRYSKVEFVKGSSAIEDPVVNNVILTLNKSQDQNGVYYNNVVTEFNTQTIHQLMDRITALEAKTSNL